MPLIIDSHAHVVIPKESYQFMAELVSSRANPVRKPQLVEASVRAAGQSIIDIMDRVGTDIQCLSPRPYMQLHSVKPSKVTAMWTAHMNDLIFETVKMFPKRFRGVAGLPQYRDESPVNCFQELEFRVKEQGFIGCLLNPDSTEGDGTPPPRPGRSVLVPAVRKAVRAGHPRADPLGRQLPGA